MPRRDSVQNSALIRPTREPCTGDESHEGTSIRLRDRRRRHRGLPARQSTVGRSGREGPAARGRRPGRLDLDQDPGRLSLLHQQSAHRLDVPDRARRGPQRPLDHLRARQGARRLLVDQRDDLHARPGAGLRRVGRADRRQLVVLAIGAADLPQERGLLPRGRRGARRRRRVARRAAAPALGHPRRVPRSDGAGGHPEDRRLQPRRQRGLRLLPRQPDEGRSPEHGARVPEAGAEPAEPHRADRSAGAPPAVRRAGAAPGSRSRAAAQDEARDRAHRNDPLGRQHRIAADPAAVRRRARARCCSSTAFRCCTRCRASARTCRTICSCAWRSR